MAVYFLNLKTFGRSTGSSAVSAAAYRSGERIHDERSGKTYDFLNRQGLLYKEILLPSGVELETDWASSRTKLWNAAEAAESRQNARVAREYLVGLPVELKPDERLKLAHEFSRELADRYRFAVDLTVHAPRDFPGSDPRNFHAHLLATTREATSQGLAGKTTLELNDSKRQGLGLKPSVYELLHVRERWASAANRALEAAHLDVRIDHRSLASQGIDREPQPHIPYAALEMERRGYRSDHAEWLRDQHQQRIQAREHAAGRAVQSGSAEQHAAPSTDTATQHTQPMSVDEIRRRARENWLRMRENPTAPLVETFERSRDDSLSR